MYPPISKATLPFVRFAQNLLPKNTSSDSTVTITKILIPVNASENIPALLYTPTDIDHHAPCLIYYHGGGFMLEAAPYHYALAKEYAVQVPCKVLFVSYRLAPKYPFPIPVKDCFVSLKWILQNAAKLGIDLNRIAIGGDSAGGNLAASVHLWPEINYPFGYADKCSFIPLLTDG